MGERDGREGEVAPQTTQGELVLKIGSPPGVEFLHQLGVTQGPRLQRRPQNRIGTAPTSAPSLLSVSSSRVPSFPGRLSLLPLPGSPAVRSGQPQTPPTSPAPRCSEPRSGPPLRLSLPPLSARGR